MMNHYEAEIYMAERMQEAERYAEEMRLLREAGAPRRRRSFGALLAMLASLI
jgi:hypothetical protein